MWGSGCVCMRSRAGRQMDAHPRCTLAGQRACVQHLEHMSQQRMWAREFGAYGGQWIHTRPWHPRRLLQGNVAGAPMASPARAKGRCLECVGGQCRQNTLRGAGSRHLEHLWVLGNAWSLFKEWRWECERNECPRRTRAWEEGRRSQWSTSAEERTQPGWGGRSRSLRLNHARVEGEGKTEIHCV